MSDWGIKEFIEAQKAVTKNVAEIGFGKLSARELATLELGFSYGMETARLANEIIRKIFKGGEHESK